MYVRGHKRLSGHNIPPARDFEVYRRGELLLRGLDYAVDGWHIMIGLPPGPRVVVVDGDGVKEHWDPTTAVDELRAILGA